MLQSVSTNDVVIPDTIHSWGPGYNIGDLLCMPFIAEIWNSDVLKEERTIVANACPGSILQRYVSLCDDAPNVPVLLKVVEQYLQDNPIECRTLITDSSTLCVHVRLGDVETEQSFIDEIHKLSTQFKTVILLAGVHADTRYGSNDQKKLNAVSVLNSILKRHNIWFWNAAPDVHISVMSVCSNLLVHKGGFSCLGSLVATGKLFFTDLFKRTKTWQQSRPTVVQVWQLSYTTQPHSFWGLGDFLRGLIVVYAHCVEYSFNYVLDIYHHPISHYLTYVNDDFRKEVDHLGEAIPFIGDVCQNMPMIMNTNSTIEKAIQVSTTPVFQSIQKFIKKLLTVKSNYQQIPCNPYTILHYRMGDQFLVDKNLHNNYDAIVSRIKKETTSTTIFCCDDTTLISLMKKEGVRVSEATPVHFGTCTDANHLLGTIQDMMLIQNAQSIQTRSVYFWISGFVHWMALVYSIPLSSERIYV